MSDEEKTGEELMKEGLAALGEVEREPYQPTNEVEEPTLEVEDTIEPTKDKKEYPEGWEPHYETLEEWEAKGKDPADYLTKEEFDRVADLRDNYGEYTRQDLAKTNVMLQKSVQEMMEKSAQMVRDAEERGRQQERQRLEAAQKEAIDYGNAEEAVEIQKQINELEAPVQQPVQPQVQPEVQQFYEQNKYWYDADSNAATLLNVHLGRAEAQGIPFEQAIQPAMQKVRESYPQYFDEAPKPKLKPKQMSERGKPVQKREKRYTFKDLPDPSMVTVAKRMIRSTGMSEHDYVKELVGE